MERLKAFNACYEAATDEDRDTIANIMVDVVAAVVREEGGGIMFVDPEGAGQMNIHIIGDAQLAPRMLAMAPVIYEKMFGVPEGMVSQ